MLPPPVISDWARKLIASEVDTDSTTAQTELATLRVYEKASLTVPRPRRS